MSRFPVPRFAVFLLQAGLSGVLGAVAGIALGFLLAGPIVIAVARSSFSPYVNPLWIELVAMELGAAIGFGAAFFYSANRLARRYGLRHCQRLLGLHRFD